VRLMVGMFLENLSMMIGLVKYRMRCFFKSAKAATAKKMNQQKNKVTAPTVPNALIATSTAAIDRVHIHTAALKNTRPNTTANKITMSNTAIVTP
jgi:hypothetical protein